MAMTVNKKPRGRSGGLNGDGRHSLGYKWQIVGDDPGAGQDLVYEALKAYGVELNMAHPTVPGHYLRNIQLEEASEDGLQWEATGAFSQYDPTATGGENPLSAKASFSVRANIRQAPVDVDLDGIPVRNSAGQRFTSPLTRDVDEPILTVVRNEPTYNPVFVRSLKDTVNGDVFMGYPAGTVRFVSHDVAMQRDQFGVVYVSVQYQFNVNWDGWTARIVDQGTVHLEDGVQVRNYDEEGISVRNDPVLLDGSGGVLPDDAEAVYKEFNIYSPMNYTPTFAFVF